MSEETAVAESLTPEEGFQAVLEGRDRDPSVAEETTEAAADSEVSEEATEEVEETEEVGEPEAEAEELSKYSLPIGDNGEEVEVDAAELKNHILRQSDYTKKTQALAEQRKALAVERNSIRAIQRLGTDLQKQFQALRQTEDSEPDQGYWDQLKVDNPMQYMIERQELQERRQERTVNERKLLHLRNQMQQQQQLEYQQNLNTEQLKLLDKIPEWAENEETATKERAELRLYGVDQGYSEKELEEVIDSRAIAILRKSYLWDQLQSKRGSLKKKVLNMPASSGAGSSLNQPRRHTELTKAKQRLAKTNSRSDAADAFQQLLDRR